MKLFKIYALIFILTISFGAAGQEVSMNKQAQFIFKNEYAPQEIKKYAGDISMIDSTKILYDGELLKFEGNPAFLSIFILGILYPDVVHESGGQHFEKNKSIKKVHIDNNIKTDTMSMERFQDLVGSKNLTFSNFKELIDLDKSPKVKRFSFWLFRKGLMNPTEYYFELTNKKATKDISLYEFIQGSRLTFIKEGSLII